MIRIETNMGLMYKCDHSGWDDAIYEKLYAKLRYDIIKEVGNKYLFMVRYLKDTGKWKSFIAYSRLIRQQLEGEEYDNRD